MARTKTKSSVKTRARRKSAGAAATKRAARPKAQGAFAKPYDAKKYEGSVPAFASVVAEEMKKWRDDR
jgi:hypothetical protein